jgi:hypothetical protein
MKNLADWKITPGRGKQLGQAGAALAGGALAGLGATVAMTAFMAAAFRLLPKWQQYPLPPRLVTVDLASRAGVVEAIDEEPATTAATAVGHFGYGAAGGALYALAAPRLGLPAGAKGALFGLLFWAASYLGWIPLAGVLAPPTRHPPQRTALMIGAHLVYGTVTGLLADRLVRLVERRR